VRARVDGGSERVDVQVRRRPEQGDRVVVDEGRRPGAGGAGGELRVTDVGALLAGGVGAVDRDARLALLLPGRAGSERAGDDHATAGHLRLQALDDEGHLGEQLLAVDRLAVDDRVRTDRTGVGQLEAVVEPSRGVGGDGRERDGLLEALRDDHLVVGDWDFVVGLFADLDDCLVAVPGFLGLVLYYLLVPVFVFFSYPLFQVFVNLSGQPIPQIQVQLLLLLMKLFQLLPALQELFLVHSAILFFLLFQW